MKKQLKLWKSTDSWESTNSYNHPEEPEAIGKICIRINPDGERYFYFRTRYRHTSMPCPQDWAARIYAQETGEPKKGGLQAELPWGVHG